MKEICTRLSQSHHKNGKNFICGKGQEEIDQGLIFFPKMHDIKQVQKETSNDKRPKGGQRDPKKNGSFSTNVSFPKGYSISVLIIL